LILTLFNLDIILLLLLLLLNSNQMEHSIANLEQNDTNEGNNQQINDSHHQQQQQSEMVASSEITDHQSTDHSNNGHPHKSPNHSIHDQHLSSHQSEDESVQARHAIIDAHTHVITETPQSGLHLKKESQHSPPNAGSGMVDHSGHGSPVQELSQATVGHSIDEKPVVSHGGSEALHPHLYSSYHQQHHQTRYDENVPISGGRMRFEDILWH